MKTLGAVVATATAVLLVGGAAAPSATRTAPKTIVAESGRIHAVAQDSGAIAWIGTHYLVHVRRLSPPHTYVVGSGIGGYVHVTHPLAVAGLQALWTTADAGNAIYTDVHTGSPSLRDRVVFNLSYMPGPADGLYLGGVAGDGSTLVFGATSQRCDSEIDCRRIDVDGHVQRAQRGGGGRPAHGDDALGRVVESLRGRARRAAGGVAR